MSRECGTKGAIACVPVVAALRIGAPFLIGKGRATNTRDRGDSLSSSPPVGGSEIPSDDIKALACFLLSSVDNLAGDFVS